MTKRADYLHMENVIKWETQRITDKKPTTEQELSRSLDEMDVLVDFLGEMRQYVLLQKLKLSEKTSDD